MALKSYKYFLCGPEGVCGVTGDSLEAAFKDAVAKKVGDNLELKRKEISKTFVS